MQRLSEEHGVSSVLRAMQFLVVRMKAHDLGPAIVAELEHLREELSCAEQAYEGARTERIAATAEIAYRDDRVDEAVLTLADEALRLCGGDRGAAAFRRLFPIAPREAIATTAGTRQHEFVRHLVECLRREPDFAPLLRHADVLESCQRALERALALREARFAPEAAAAARRSERMDAACRSFNRCHARLQLLRTDPALLESLFPKLANARPYDAEGTAE